MYDNPRRLRRPKERVGHVTNADLPPPVASVEETVLVERIRARDESAFGDLLERYYSPMLRTALNFVRSPEEAEEVIQETWIAVLNGIDRFEGRSTFRTWLFRILINRARSRAQREARCIPLSALPAPGDGDRLALELDPHAPSHSMRGPDPEQALLSTELRTVLERAVSELPRPQRVVISLRDIEGWSADEVCAAMKISAGNQRVLLHRARMSVREKLVPYLGVEEAVMA